MTVTDASFFEFYFSITVSIQHYFVFQVYSIAVRQSDTLQSGPPDISTTRLVPYIVIILVTVFPVCDRCFYLEALFILTAKGLILFYFIHIYVFKLIVILDYKTSAFSI